MLWKLWILHIPLESVNILVHQASDLVRLKLQTFICNGQQIKFNFSAFGLSCKSLWIWTTHVGCWDHQRLEQSLCMEFWALHSDFLHSRTSPSVSNSCSSALSARSLGWKDGGFSLRAFITLCYVIASISLKLKVIKSGNSPHASPVFLASNTL